MADIPSNCSTCNAAIYAQWWDNAENAYRCRVCGTLNPGPPWLILLVITAVATWRTRQRS